MSKYIGIDVSDNQQVIDWKSVAEDGCKFAILRSIRHSGKEDYQFAANLEGCRANNIPVAVYKYTYAKNSAEAEKEANQVVELLQKNNLICKVFWDVEDREYLYGLGKDKLTDVIKAAQKVINDAGLEFCLYVGLYVYKEKWFDFARFDCPIWVARYPIKGTKTIRDIPSEQYRPDVGRDIIGWQFTSTGKVKGISTSVDLNVFYVDPTTLCQKENHDISEDVTNQAGSSYIFMTAAINKNQAETLFNTARVMNITAKLYKSV